MAFDGEKRSGRVVGVRDEVRRASAVLADAGVGAPRVDAELLAAYVLDTTRGRLPLAEPFTDEQARRYAELIAARAARTPVQHLTGTAPFRHLELAVGPGVFIPRPETELLVEWGMVGLGRDSVVVDLCSGSGAVAISVAVERPGTRVFAVEADPLAMRWLTGNIARLADGMVTPVAADARDPMVLSRLDGLVDRVLCNPPYVPADTIVEAEVAGGDPAVAVFGGADGLEVIRGIVPRAAALLRPGGAVGIEHDDGNGGGVVGLLLADGRFEQVADHCDLAGRPRFATAVRRDTGVGGLAH
jgi:release factor glutamine methyltransferase